MKRGVVKGNVVALIRYFGESQEGVPDLIGPLSAAVKMDAMAEWIAQIEEAPDDADLVLAVEAEWDGLLCNVKIEDVDVIEGGAFTIESVDVEEEDEGYSVIVHIGGEPHGDLEYRIIDDSSGDIVRDWQDENEFTAVSSGEYIAEVRQVVEGEVVYSTQSDVFYVGADVFEATSEGSDGQLQTFTVPETGSYRITAFGASGGDLNTETPYGRGAKMSGVFELNENQELTILVGQEGGINDTSGGQAGGGGSFVVDVFPPNHKDIEEISVVFNTMSNTPDATFEQPLIDILTSSGMSVDTVSDDDLTSFDFSGYDILLTRAPGDDFEDHPELSFIQNLELPVMTFSRKDAREILGIGDASGADTQSDFYLSPDPNFTLSGYKDNVTLYDSEDGHAVWDIGAGEPGTVILAIDGRDLGIAYRFRDNGYVGVHSSMHRGNSLTQQGEEVFVSVVQHAVTAKNIEDLYQPLIVAGGGAGSAARSYNSDPHGRVDTRGPDYHSAGNPTDGGGGGGGSFARAGGGHSTHRGRSFLTGGRGGAIGGWAEGGYGGGGGKGGSHNEAAGGGGYDGGDIAREEDKGGGGSYNAGTDQDNEPGVRDGHGLVLIQTVD